MCSRTTLPRGAIAAVGFSFLITQLACRDAVTIADAKNSLAVKQLLNVPEASIRERSRLYERNSSARVGTAHNKVLEDFRVELARPGVLSHELCNYVMSFVAARARLSGEKPPRGVVRASAAAAAAAVGLCQQRGRAAEASLYGFFHGQGTEGFEISEAANHTLAGIQNAVDGAVDRYDLATRLNILLDASASLSDGERQIVEATAAVAQSSYEYWEVELPVFQQEVWNEYSGCADRLFDLDYGVEDARLVCMDGGALMTRNPWSDGSGTLFMTASLRNVAGCELGSHFKRLVGVDVVGGVVGAVKGFVAAGPAGAGAGAFGGAAYASLGTFLNSTWELYWCAMKPK